MSPSVLCLSPVAVLDEEGAVCASTRMHGSREGGMDDPAWDDQPLLYNFSSEMAGEHDSSSPLFRKRRAF